jgi:microbial collagenase
MRKPLKIFLLAAVIAAVPLAKSSLAAPPAPHAAVPAPVPAAAQSEAALPAEIGKARQSAQLPPRTPHKPDRAAAVTSLAASCTAADFGSRTGSALVSFVKSSTVDCVNTLFSLTGTAAFNAFRESQMVTIANALRDTSYPGDNSTSVEQLVLFLRAGYYVQFYHPTDVGTYGSSLRTAIRGGLDAFFAAPRSQDVTDANGAVLGEAVILIDSSGENARYIYVLRRLLIGFTSQYNQLWYMRNAVNSTFTVFFRGHQVPEFMSAVVADPSILDVLYNFTNTNFSLLGTDSSFLISNSGGELTRFLDNSSLRPKVRTQAKALLDRSAMTGVTAPLWVHVADLATTYDAANCAYYGICNFKTSLEASVLPIRYVCSATVTIRAQDISSANLAATCTSLANQVAYFHNLVRDHAIPVANDNNTSIEVVAFHSSTDYQTYAGVLFGIDTNNGGMYLEGNPAAAGNIARFIAYEAEWLRPTFAIWNLNHEFTHYLDGRFDTYGDFDQTVSVPDIWWVEGVAEYVSYGYRGVPYQEAIAEAGRHTYALSTLWDTTYENTNTNRTYRWGYLAVRYMFERHAADVDAMLAKFRVGDYTGGRAVYATTIGTRYNADFNTWLDACAAGACGTGTNVPPTAAFTSVVNGLTATFTDASTDSDGTVASRQWAFGDGTTSTATNPVHSYATAGTYTVTLTVTDNRGATGTRSAQITVAGGGLPECTGADVRALDRNCQRSNLSSAGGQIVYLYIYLPAGVSTLNIGSSGGTGNADLYYNANGWATPSSYTARSVNTGNTESLTITSPAAGYRYISLYATSAFSGVTVTTRY